MRVKISKKSARNKKDTYRTKAYAKNFEHFLRVAFQIIWGEGGSKCK